MVSLRCECESVPISTQPTLTRKRMSANAKTELLRPPQERPVAPRGFSIGRRMVDISDVDIRYFADRTVSPHTSYTYTLFAYDDSEHCSYPIIVNTSLDYWSAGTICGQQAESLSSQ